MIQGILVTTNLSLSPQLIHHLAVTVPTGTVLPSLSFERTFLIIGLSCILAVIALIVLVAVLSRKQKTAPKPQKHVITSNDIQGWHKKVDHIVDSYNKEQLTQSQAMSQLAEIVRQFASQALGKDIRTKTLAEINQHPRTDSNKRQIDLLRQTISALYPPEFADPKINRQALEAQVPQAAQWVSTLVERWQE